MIITCITGLFFGFLLVFGDIATAHLYAYPCLASLSCWYFLCVFFRKSPYLILSLLIFIGCESLLYYERFGLTWLYIIPLTLIMLRLKHTVHFAPLIPYGALVFSLICRELILVPWLTQSPILGRYTGYMICGNVIMMVLMHHLIIPLTLPRTR